jgi:hypothetical protein
LSLCDTQLWYSEIRKQEPMNQNEKSLNEVLKKLNSLLMRENKIQKELGVDSEQDQEIAAIRIVIDLIKEDLDRIKLIKLLIL